MTALQGFQFNILCWDNYSCPLNSMIWTAWETVGPLYMDFFKIHIVNVFSLAYLIIRILYTMHITYRMCVNLHLLLIRLPVYKEGISSKFSGSEKLYGFSAAWGWTLLTPHCSGINCTLFLGWWVSFFLFIA